MESLVRLQSDDSLARVYLEAQLGCWDDVASLPLCRVSSLFCSMWTLHVVFAAGESDFLHGGGLGIPKVQNQTLPGLLKTLAQSWYSVLSAIAHLLKQVTGPAQIQ